ncbi:hypothetical protein BDV29DRAFT_174257 [Aspergillus leporis]|jgi:hypothetical protein|uniref:Uncharacterized protein n=1 Tax=Aspergillus leporis TaxID=41062 RepID=A0A5N5X016_9EURO|nr:hypothetical protein BDV29DRAFT_174257 [Aspergillus leporis]
MKRNQKYVIEVRSKRYFFFLFCLYIGQSLFVSVHELVGVNKMHDEVFAGLSGCLCVQQSTQIPSERVTAAVRRASPS